MPRSAKAIYIGSIPIVNSMKQYTPITVKKHIDLATAYYLNEGYSRQNIARELLRLGYQLKDIEERLLRNNKPGGQWQTER